MDVKQAVAIAKSYVEDIFSGEKITNVDLEETEYDKNDRTWRITLAFSRPWGTARTRAQEILENLGAAPPGRRAYKILTIAEDGTVVSMKNPQRSEMAD